VTPELNPKEWTAMGGNQSYFSSGGAFVRPLIYSNLFTCSFLIKRAESHRRRG
jgi:hypothetical protein